MKANEPFRIIEFINPRTQAISFRVTGMLDGKQIRKNRKTIEEATNLKQDYERQALNLVSVAHHHHAAHRRSGGRSGKLLPRPGR
jgi:hypothetical protein